MAGGYLSLQGIYGSARYHRTPIEEVLPVTISAVDDRVEKPEGINPIVKKAEHPIMQGVEGEWPYLLGFKRGSTKRGCRCASDGRCTIRSW